MGEGTFGKRAFLKVGLKAGAALAAAGAAGAAHGQKRRLFGIDIPDEVADLLPAKPLEYAQLAESIIALEKEADGRRLPPSPLSRGSGSPIAALDDAIYQVVLPRLVALIDRSEAVDPGLADKAGGLLAQLHRTQYQLPEALRLSALAPAVPDRRGLLRQIAFQAEPEALPPPPDEIATVAVEVVQPLPAQPDPPSAPPPPADAPQAGVDPQDEPNAPLSRSRSYDELRGEYRRMFANLSARSERSEAIDFHLAMIRKSRERYERAGTRTGVPWFFIAVTHALEASFNFRAHLHNGDFPLSSRTRQVPAGRPRVWLPPSDWESSAIDALKLLGFTGQSDWSMERTLYRLEAYNGFGYRRLGVPTPYLWSFSQHYERGKFVADGKFDRSARSQQCGAAVMLKRLDEAGEIDWGVAV
jgi:lysozyme family protein